MEIKTQINDHIIVEHPSIKGLFVKLTTTPNSVKAQCFNRHMSVADYNTKTHTYGGAVYFFNGDPTDRNNELRNTTYFEDMQKSLTDKALDLERREQELKDRESRLKYLEQFAEMGLRADPEDLFVFELSEGNVIKLRRKHLKEVETGQPAAWTMNRKRP